MLCRTFTEDLLATPRETVDARLIGEIPGEIPGHSFADEFLASLDRPSPRARVCSGAASAVDDCIHVLDVGTGTARIPIKICSRRNDVKFTAIDQAARALKTARRDVEQAGMHSAITIENADARALPYANASFDAVISCGLLHHVANRRGVLYEMARVLRPGGLLFVRDTLRGPDARQIAQILTRASGAAVCSRRACRSSFQAMLNITEARDLALAVNLPPECVRQSGPRHWVLAFRLQAAQMEINDWPQPAQAEA